MTVSNTTIVDRKDHVQYLAVSKSYSDACTPLIEQNIAINVICYGSLILYIAHQGLIQMKTKHDFKNIDKILLKLFISFKNVIIRSICVSRIMLSIWKHLFLTCAKSPHSKRK